MSASDAALDLALIEVEVVAERARSHALFESTISFDPTSLNTIFFMSSKCQKKLSQG